LVVSGRDHSESGQHRGTERKTLVLNRVQNWAEEKRTDLCVRGEPGRIKAGARGPTSNSHTGNVLGEGSPQMPIKQTRS